MFSCRNYTIFHVRNAISLKTFIVMAKILMVIRSINAGLAFTNLPQTDRA